MNRDEPLDDRSSQSGRRLRAAAGNLNVLRPEPPPTLRTFRGASGWTRRRFLNLAVAAAGTPALLTRCRSSQSPSVLRARAGFELEEITVAQLQEAMRSGRLSSHSITQMYLNRIQELDRRGPGLRAIIEVNPDALSEAERLDEERREGHVRGPLHGIPVVLKDNIDSADRMTTTAGSLALEGSIAVRDSQVASRLREAGAVLLAKGNLSEWANFRSTRSSSGWSGRGGQCRNPYDLSRNPCGSSSGSAVSVSANLAPLSIGTETNGSIVCPAGVCGIVGIKPTVGLVGRSGIIPISHTQDSAGPMARTVADAALLLGALTGIDPRDSVTQGSRGKSYGDYTPFLDWRGLKGARIGVVRQFFGSHPAVHESMERSLDLLQREGAELIDGVELPGRRQTGHAPLTLMLFEFKAGLNAYLSNLGPSAPLKSLEEIIAFNEEHKAVEMPYFGQELFIQAQEKGPLTDPEYLEALETTLRLSREEGIDKVMDEHDLDALVAPTGGPAWKTDLLNGDPSGGESSSPAARAGYPNITVPAGNVRGLPIGISFFGRAWSEPRLLRIAYAFEQSAHARIVPRFRDSIL